MLNVAVLGFWLTGRRLLELLTDRDFVLVVAGAGDVATLQRCVEQCRRLGMTDEANVVEQLVKLVARAQKMFEKLQAAEASALEEAQQVAEVV